MFEQFRYLFARRRRRHPEDDDLDVTAEFLSRRVLFQERLKPGFDGLGETIAVRSPDQQVHVFGAAIVAADHGAHVRRIRIVFVCRFAGRTLRLTVGDERLCDLFENSDDHAVLHREQHRRDQRALAARELAGHGDAEGADHFLILSAAGGGHQQSAARHAHEQARRLEDLLRLPHECRIEDALGREVIPGTGQDGERLALDVDVDRLPLCRPLAQRRQRLCFERLLSGVQLREAFGVDEFKRVWMVVADRNPRHVR